MKICLAAAGGHAQIGFASLARTVDDAAHDGHANRRGHVLQPFGHRVGQLNHVHLGTAAGRQEMMSNLRGRNPMYSSSLQPTFTSSTGGADSETRIVSPMPSAKQRAECQAAFDCALPGRAGFGDAQMQRPIALWKPTDGTSAPW